MSRKRRRKRRKGSRGKYAWLALMLSVLCVLACVGIAAVYFLLRPAGTGTVGKAPAQESEQAVPEPEPTEEELRAQKAGRF